MSPKEFPSQTNDTNLNNEYPSSDDYDKIHKEILNLSFDGKAIVVFGNDRKIFSRSHSDESNYNKLVHILNQNSEEISELICKEIQKSLPVIEPNISVNIDFKDGSIAWGGLVTLSDVLSRLDGTVGGIKLIVDTVKFAINKIVRTQIESTDNVAVKKIDTNVVEKIVKEKPINTITRLLWWCSGAVTEILQKHPEDKSKYQTIGAGVLSTGFLAFCSGGYAFYTVFIGNEKNNEYAIILGVVFGLIWGLIIFNIDRSIVSSMRKDDNENNSWYKRLLFESRFVIPRIALAIILGLVISKPLELRIFQNKILTKATENKQIHTGRYVDSLRSGKYCDRIESAKYKLNIASSSLDSARQDSRNSILIFNKEMDMRGGTKIYGYGKVAKQKELDKKRDLKKVEALEKIVDSLQNESKIKMNEIENDIAKDRAQYEKGFVNDFSERLQALGEIIESNKTIRSADNGIMILFITLELVPILIKLFSSVGPYDSELNSKEKKFVLGKKNDLSIAFVKMDNEMKDVLQKQQIYLTELNENKDASENIIRHRKNLLINSEKEFLDHLFMETRDIRTKEANWIIKNWSFNSNTDLSSSFDNLYRFLLKMLSINTKQ